HFGLATGIAGHHRAGFSHLSAGIFYRPASLYHPQRRAILHLKGLQKRSKAKDKNVQKDKPPFFDLTVLRSRTVQILIGGSALSAFGVQAPFFCW
ncbi:monocarboxylate transporter 12, partial [Trichonephila clavata]